MRKAAFIFLPIAAVLAGTWFIAADWPNPELKPLPWEPEAIVVLGGGDADRIAEAWRLAVAHPDAPIIVTGDGGSIVRALREKGVAETRLRHEVAAKSTRENAEKVRPIIEAKGLRRVVLVTNWYHARRALLSFRQENPGVEFAVSFKLRRNPVTPWDREAQRRERLALAAYLLY